MQPRPRGEAARGPGRHPPGGGAQGRRAEGGGGRGGERGLSLRSLGERWGQWSRGGGGGGGEEMSGQEVSRAFRGWQEKMHEGAGAEEGTLELGALEGGQVEWSV